MKCDLHSHSFTHRLWGKEEEESGRGPDGRRCAFIFMRETIEINKLYNYAFNLWVCVYVLVYFIVYKECG